MIGGDGGARKVVRDETDELIHFVLGFRLPNMGSRPWVRHLAAIAGYLGIALTYSWPLPLRLDSALTGTPSGDTGVYVWNLWTFHHELSHGHSPFFAREILSLRTPVPLTLHNYTTFANLVAYPLIPIFGVTTTFNLIYLVSSVFTAYAMFLLARQVTRSTGASWLAGVLFGFSPTLIARGTGHFSLVQAAAIPIFLLLIRRLEQGVSVFHAALAGATLAWAYLCDPYYAVYALLLGCVYSVATHSRIEWLRLSPRVARLRWRLDIFTVVLFTVSLMILLSGGGVFTLAGQRVSMTTGYTPMLVVAILVVVRVALTVRARWVGPRIPYPLISPRVVGPTLVACVVPLLPLLDAMRAGEADASWLWPKVFWRSSPPGVDAIAFVLPNPNHALFGEWSARWLASRPNGFGENVASMSFVALITIVTAYLFYRFRRGHIWLLICAAFAWLSLGPFMTIGGFHTHMLTPWGLLRYVPIIGGARMPARFVIVVLLAFAMLFAMALKRITAPHRSRRQLILAVVGVALLFELSPYPRRLYDATIPTIYQTIANDPREIRVLEIPAGIRDGLSTHGNFSAAAQYYQTLHKKRLIGGYLSRVPDAEIRATRRRVVYGSLIRLSEGDALTSDELRRAKRRAPGFVERARIGWIVIDLHRTSPDLIAFVEEAFQPQLVREESGRRLYRTACCRLPSTARVRQP